MWIDGKYMNQFEVAGDHARTKKTLRDQKWIIGVPPFPGITVYTLGQ